MAGWLEGRLGGDGSLFFCEGFFCECVGGGWEGNDKNVEKTSRKTISKP